ncbi:WecB/TagA/CpsF family glycosyltransferase [Bosea sp. 124]|uniref:WecB/TagA/CpsF family glycosyltransferase n=1 Tax=Bosea sp. 124 TaxID=2135642 RepID=UPI000D42B35B|nr:WecB/TagA/CpsF family glycosyltransferase [Bosea sp. 124]PTM40375.1 exopolysaccharide biosynthesis WecB/TagA/CpsF family protein [Bosea sp. 124]
MPASLSIALASQAAARTAAHFDVRDIGGIGIAVLTRAAAHAEISDAMATGRHLKLAFCNANLVNIAAQDPPLQRLLAGFLVLADGIGVDIGSRLLHGTAFPANLNGTDFIPFLLAAERRPLRVALIGGRPGIADRAAARLRRDFPHHAFSVVSHGYFAPSEEAGLLSALKAAPPDLLLVAFGNSRQEGWIADRLGPQHCAVAAGVGALFDFFAGEVPRAPEAIRRMRLEWVYRLGLEPRRLWRRYVVGNPVFLLRLLRQRLLAGRSAR